MRHQSEHHHHQEGECNRHQKQGSCGCQHGHFQRRYQTKTEQIEKLETYLSDLKLEVQAVEELLADLRK